MSVFEFVNHDSYPEDQYIAESCTLCFDGKYRVTYVRKKMQDGGMFWAEISASVKKHGEKKYLRSFSQDSNFLQEDIKSFLDGRQWERGVHGAYKPASGGKVAQSDEVPF